MIYADNAATTQLDQEAFEAMLSFLVSEYGNASQSYMFASAEKKALKEARGRIAECIMAEPDEIYFTSGGTESDNWAIKMGCRVHGGEIVTSEIEHHAVLRSCQAMKENGVLVRYIPVDETGVVRLPEANKLIGRQTGLVSVMMANNEIGSLQPIKELAQIAHANGALFHTDAVQAVGHVRIDVKDLGIDLLSASAHKFNAPKGIGFLFIKGGTNIQPYMSGGAQEKGMRAGTENVASIMAMSVALSKNVSRMEENTKKMKEYEHLFVDILNRAGVDFIVNGSANKVPGNISLSINNFEGEVLMHRLDLMGTCVSTGSACDSVNTQVSHVLKAINLPESYAKGTIRISLGYDNTRSEIVQMANQIVNIVQKEMRV